jgi:hypothetical protein
MKSVDVWMEEVRIIILHILAYVRVFHQYIVISEALSTSLRHLLTGKIIFVTVFLRSKYLEEQIFVYCTLMPCSNGLVLFISRESIINRRQESRSCKCSSLVSSSILHHKLDSRMLYTFQNTHKCAAKSRAETRTLTPNVLNLEQQYSQWEINHLAQIIIT